MKLYKEHLLKARQIIFYEKSRWSELNIAMRVMHQIFADITGIQGAIQNRDEGYETQLESGFALSPGFAADCILDTRRTVKYIRALDGAVQMLQLRHPGTPVHVLYAGCGPFAPFAIALCERYSPKQVQFTVLDIHHQSIAAVQHIVSELKLSGWFRAFVQCDATSYCHGDTNPIHIAITETMHQTVSREPQAAITLNLSQQLVNDGVFIPERITVSAALSDTEKEVQYIQRRIDREAIRKVRVDMGPVFELSKDSLFEFSGDGDYLLCAIKKVPEISERNAELILSTHIQLFGDICLEELESGITQPCFYRDIETLRPGDMVQFQFRLTGVPGLNCQKLFMEDMYKELDIISVSNQ